MLPVSDTLFHSIIESLNEGLIISDLDGRVSFVNRRCTELLGYTLDDFGTEPAYRLLVPPQHWAAVENHWRDNRSERSPSYEIQLQCKSGSLLWASISGGPLRDEQQQVEGTLDLITDISEHKRLSETQRQMATIIEATTDFVAIADKDGCATFVNKAGRAMLGLSEDAARGRPLGSWHPEWARNKIVQEGVGIAAREGVWVDETAIVDKHGRQVPVSQVILVHKDESGDINYISTIARDISERKATEKQIETQKQAFEEQKRELEVMNAQLRELATVDGLTSLKNQRAFYERLQDVTQYSIRYYVSHSLLLLDVDNFKEYNDSFGHLAGDEVLREIALILLEQTRDTDFVARYGGEEFAAILPLANREESRLTAERIRRAVAIKKWPHRPVTISIGVATAIGNEYEVRDFVLAADQALYESKRRGRNRVTCVDDLSKHTGHGHVGGVIDPISGSTQPPAPDAAAPVPGPVAVGKETRTP